MANGEDIIMSIATPIKISVGLPESCREQAAIMYDDAFRQKYEPIIRSQEDRIEILAQSFHPDLAIVALEGERLVGLAGFCYRGRAFFSGGNAYDVIKKFGLFKGLKGVILLSLFIRRPCEGELLMDGIAVDVSMRGRGIGTQLFSRLTQYAQEQGYVSIRLDVVDTNTRARCLYERLGFVAEHTKKYPFLKHIMGFSASTMMVKRFSG